MEGECFISLIMSQINNIESVEVWTLPTTRSEKHKLTLLRISFLETSIFITVQPSGIFKCLNHVNKEKLTNQFLSRVYFLKVEGYKIISIDTLIYWYGVV